MRRAVSENAPGAIPPQPTCMHTSRVTASENDAQLGQVNIPAVCIQPGRRAGCIHRQSNCVSFYCFRNHRPGSRSKRSWKSDFVLNWKFIKCSEQACLAFCFVYVFRLSRVSLCTDPLRKRIHRMYCMYVILC
jgi:hypothetical protein